jgi:transposase
LQDEHSTGNSVRRGSITKTGNAHARRLLTEAAWSYRFPARMSQQLRQRSSALPETVRNHAWKAQQRLCGRFARLSSRGVQVNKVCVAGGAAGAIHLHRGLVQLAPSP